MPKYNFYARPTATTFQNVPISARMNIRFSARDNLHFHAHIVRYQLTAVSEDLHLPELQQTLGIAGLGQLYHDIVYPRITRALKQRISTLESLEDHRPSPGGVIDGDKIRLPPTAALGNPASSTSDFRKPV
ncbi:hypothetical protein LX36DRAFT_712988 [Colletotrichum falcatum]|nr:hypothetical protein LX36DRAFT_712988 [Colletotrichum falcatum]